MSLKYHMEHIPELDLDADSRQQIADLVQQVFPDGEYRGRHYFKQLAHSRLIVRDKLKIIAQAGLDYRVMRMNDQPIKVLGIIDLAVAPTYQGQGLGAALLKEAESLAATSKLGVDFIFLVTEIHEYYRKHGFKLAATQVQWLAIDQHQNLGVLDQFFDDCLMYKQMGDIAWENGQLDMLGYWY